MDQCIEWLKSKGYKTIDITKLVNERTYGKYTSLATRRKNTVFYFKREPTNNIIFKFSLCMDTVNYYFINNDNYIFTMINDVFDPPLKRRLENFLNIKGNFECGICTNEILVTSHCLNCHFCICRHCIQKISQDVNNKIIFNCPQCRQEQVWQQS